MPSNCSTSSRPQAASSAPSAPNSRVRYLTVEERKGYAWAVTNRNSGGLSYTLLWWCGTRKGGYEPSGDWEAFVKDMRQLAG